MEKLKDGMNPLSFCCDTMSTGDLNLDEGCSVLELPASSRKGISLLFAETETETETSLCFLLFLNFAQSIKVRGRLLTVPYSRQAIFFRAPCFYRLRVSIRSFCAGPAGRLDHYGFSCAHHSLTRSG
jgi:hypothetical protein